MRPERLGLKVAEVMVDAGDSVSAGPGAGAAEPARGRPGAGAGAGRAADLGLDRRRSARLASGKGEALFSIIARGEFDLVGMVPTRDIAKLQVNQTARIKIIGAGEVDGKVRRLATTVEPNSQLGAGLPRHHHQPPLLVNSSGRAQIKTGQSCGVSVPLTAILYGYRRHRGAGGPARPRRDAAGGNRTDVGGPGRDHARACRKATSWSHAPARCCARATRCGAVMASADAK